MPPVCDGWFLTRSGYEPKPVNGVFVYDEQDRERFEALAANELEQMLGSREEDGIVYSNDNTLRFVPFGYKTGEMTPAQLGKHAYVIALEGEAGREGAEKLAEVADTHENKPHLWSFESVSEPTTRVSALDSIRNLGRRLYVNGDDHGYCGGGCAFGVKKSGEASAPKK